MIKSTLEFRLKDTKMDNPHQRETPAFRKKEERKKQRMMKAKLKLMNQRTIHRRGSTPTWLLPTLRV